MVDSCLLEGFKLCLNGPLLGMLQLFTSCMDQMTHGIPLNTYYTSMILWPSDMYKATTTNTFSANCAKVSCKTFRFSLGLLSCGNLEWGENCLMCWVYHKRTYHVMIYTFNLCSFAEALLMYSLMRTIRPAKTTELAFSDYAPLLCNRWPTWSLRT